MKIKKNIYSFSNLMCYNNFFRLRIGVILVNFKLNEAYVTEEHWSTFQCQVRFVVARIIKELKC